MNNHEPDLDLQDTIAIHGQEDSVDAAKTSLPSLRSEKDNHIESRLTGNREYQCWLVCEEATPYQVTLGWDGHSDHMWSLGTGRVQRTKIYATEKEAIAVARKHAKEQEEFWYARVRQLDARVDEIELAELNTDFAAINAGIREQR